MSKAEDLTGKRFGHLVALKRHGRRHKSATWICQCDCGKEKLAKSIYLKKGVTRSCGDRASCDFAWKLLSTHENIEGMRFGRLTVVERVRTDRGPRWVCVCDCGSKAKTTASKLKSGHTTSCGCYQREQVSNRRGDKRYNWKGGRFLCPHGYVKILLPGHHRANQRGYVYEHLVVMENKLGRRLTGKENVHHLNGDRQDNREENLELWSVSQPKGQRVEDKLEYAIEIIKAYGDKRLLAKLMASLDGY